jgi:hypothetical protein
MRSSQAFFFVSCGLKEKKAFPKAVSWSLFRKRAAQKKGKVLRTFFFCGGADKCKI